MTGAMNEMVKAAARALMVRDGGEGWADREETLDSHRWNRAVIDAQTALDAALSAQLPPPIRREGRDVLEKLESYCFGLEGIANWVRPPEIRALFDALVTPSSPGITYMTPSKKEPE